MPAWVERAGVRAALRPGDALPQGAAIVTKRTWIAFFDLRRQLTQGLLLRRGDAVQVVRGPGPDVLDPRCIVDA